MLVLGIETTCDETACAVVKDGREILANVVTSQIDLHAEYGGVVPELSCRRHVDVIIPVIREALLQASLSLNAINLIAVAHGPGLIGPLLIGLTSAKSLALATGIPYIGVNHVEAHLYAALMSHEDKVDFPCLGVVLSGGHTSLVRMNTIGSYELIGETVDDAIGEAFDKVGKILGLPYPGGPQIERLAAKGDPSRFAFKPGNVKGYPLKFSFSGLKTAVLYALKGQNGEQTQPMILSEKEMADVSASFQHVILKDVIDKTLLAAGQSGCQTILFGGGVTNNQQLRRQFAETAPTLHCLWPSKGLSLDNAAMIAGLGYHHYLKRGCGDSLDLEALTRICL
jgi:N6-L-threonylcarbamoyladenine synthase